MALGHIFMNDRREFLDYYRDRRKVLIRVLKKLRREIEHYKKDLKEIEKQIKKI